MPRPKSKSELQSLSKENLLKLFDLINAIPEGEQMDNFPEGMLNRNIRDVLGHLHEWHIMFLNWYKTGMSGEKPTMPAEGYSWKDLPELNKNIQLKYAKTSLDKIMKKFRDSNKKIENIIESHTNEELFEKKRYHWTGSTSLGAYLISSTSSHYDWAIKLIRKAMKARIKQYKL